MFEAALCVILPLLVCSAAELPSGSASQTVLLEDFETGNPLSRWSGSASLDKGFRSSHGVHISSGVATRILDVTAVRDCTLTVSATLKAENVSPKPNPWNGIKCMLVIETADGTDYPQASLETGSFDWRPTTFRVRVPENARKVTLVLGLEQVTGNVWFDDLKITAARRPHRNIVPISGPPFKGHDLPRLRGAMVSPNLDTEGLKVLGGDWKANLIRFQLIRFGKPGSGSTMDDYDSWIERELAKLDRLLPECHKRGVLVVVDLHSPPGGKATVSGYVGSDGGLFSSRQAQDRFVEVWRKISRRYRNEPAIWGYDLANEPVEGEAASDCDDWPALATRAAKAIREIDPTSALIVEPADWGGPEALRDFEPIPVSNVVYSVHMYLPHAFTHQGVHNSGPPLTYPGVIQGKTWDRDQTERALAPVVDFQLRFNVHIYIGEFSAIRWAPDGSACRYLRDVIDVFEKHGWDWSYHAFREWQGWSVEHGPDRADEARSIAPTDRQQLLCDWFSRNKKPVFNK